MDPEALIEAAMKLAEQKSQRDLAEIQNTTNEQSSEAETIKKSQLQPQPQPQPQQEAAEERDTLSPLAPTIDSNNNSNSEDPMGWLTQSGLSEDQKELIRMAMTPKAGHKKSMRQGNNFDDDSDNNTNNANTIPKNIVDPMVSGTPSKNKPKIQIEMAGMNMKKQPKQKSNKSTKSTKSGKSRKKKSSLSAAISVYSAPVGDMTVVAFVDEWRDGMWDIFSHGVCHPALLLPFFAPVCK